MALDRILPINLLTMNNIHSEIKKPQSPLTSEYNRLKIVLVVLFKANEYNE